MFCCVKSDCSVGKRCRLQANKIQHTPCCPTCGSEMIENCRARDAGDRVLGLLVCSTVLKNMSSKDAVRQQSVLVCFQGMYGISYIFQNGCNEFLLN